MSTKRIIPGLGVKDDAGHYVKAENTPSAPPSPVAPPAGPIDADVSLEDVHQRLLLVLDRETRRLATASASNELTRDQGSAFERCVKVLREFKKEEREYLEATKTTGLDKDDPHGQ